MRPVRTLTVLEGWTAFSTSQHQSNARVLGSLDYQTQHGEGFSKATRFLLELVDSKVGCPPSPMRTRVRATTWLIRRCYLVYLHSRRATRPTSRRGATHTVR